MEAEKNEPTNEEIFKNSKSPKLPKSVNFSQKEEVIEPKIAKQESFTIPYETDEFDEKYLDIEKGVKDDPSNLPNDSKPDKKSNKSSLKSQYSAPPLPEKVEKLPRKSTGMPKKRRSSIWESFSSNKFALRSLRRISTYKGRVAKPANAYIRWYLLFTFFLVFFISSAFWIPCIPAVRRFAMEIVIIVLIILHLLWLVAVVNNFRYLIKLRSFAHHKIDFGKDVPNIKKIKHLVGIAFYKEPIELMFDTLDSLATQPNARQKISVFAGMEEGTPDKEEKTQQLKALYMAKFERFYVTVHPKGLPGDIPGKCSNFNYGSRMAIKYLKEDRSYGLDKNTELMVTTGDCDTIFGERYFDALEEDYLKLTPEQRSITVWQSPLFYCINIDKSPFFVRNVGLLRSFFMMGYLIPWNINTMSVFSLTLKLYEDGEYTHPGYQMDDIIALIRWMCVTGKRCVVRPIPVATLSGPTSGKNYVDEFYEWARQIRRWTIGAAEVFHYFAIKSKKLPFFVSLAWASRFIFYYGFLLCIASCYGIITPFVTVAMLKAVGHHPAHGIVIKDEWTFNWIMLGCLGLQYVWFFFVFLFNKLSEPIFPNKIRDETGIIRNVFHFIMMWPTLTVYCLVEVFAFLEVTVRGKAVCSHNASKKDGLVKTGGNAVHPITDKNPDRFDV